MAISIQFGSYTMVGAVKSWGEQGNVRIIAQTIAGFDGAVLDTTTPPRDSRIISIRGMLFGSSQDNLRTLRDNLRAALNSGVQKLHFYTDRYLNAYMENCREKYVKGSAGTVLEYDVDFFCADPFVYGNEIVYDMGTVLYWTNPEKGDVKIIHNPGNVIIYPRFRMIVGDAGNSESNNISVTNDTISKSFILTTAIGIKNGFEVNTSELTVRKTSVVAYIDYTGYWMDDNYTGTPVDDRDNWSGDFIWLEPGDNSITCTWDDVVNVNRIHMGIRFNPRWQ